MIDGYALPLGLPASLETRPCLASNIPYALTAI